MSKASENERMNMSKEELLRAILLLDKIVDLCWVHVVSEDGFPTEPSNQGFWCKTLDERYQHLFYDTNFFYMYGRMRVDVPNDSIITWQRLLS